MYGLYSGKPRAQLNVVGSSAQGEGRMHVGGKPAVLPHCICHLTEQASFPFFQG